MPAIIVAILNAIMARKWTSGTIGVLILGVSLGWAIVNYMPKYALAEDLRVQQMILTEHIEADIEGEIEEAEDEIYDLETLEAEDRASSRDIAKIKRLNRKVDKLQQKLDEFKKRNQTGTPERLLMAPSGGFLEQIAKVESDYGSHPNTFTGGSCGIWQVDKIGLEDTQDLNSHPNLDWRHHNIYSLTGIRWKDVCCDDLCYPVLCALAARMYLLNIPEEFPQTLQGRAEYWKNNYNSSEGKGTIDHFIREVMNG
jgi:hypothetical protein